jgi:hypothetical protein
MGLDMYLTGRKFLFDRNQIEDGFPIEVKLLELGYWRKHPNLHGYIVNTFASGRDDCKDIPLEIEDLEKILAASEADELPHTEGFFFGVSQPEDKDDTRETLTKAIEWLKTEEEHVSRSVKYRASW